MFKRKPTAAQELANALLALADMRRAAAGCCANFTVVEAVDRVTQAILYRLEDAT